MRQSRLVATLVGLLLLSGCHVGRDAVPTGSVARNTPGTGQPAEAARRAEFNASDVMFLQMLIHHQEQTLRITRMGASDAEQSQVRDLAEAIRLTQTDEVVAMKSWLADWKQPVAVDPRAPAHAEHGGLPVTFAEDVAGLKTLRGRDFDTAFLNVLLAHQHRAVEMAEEELAKGSNEQAREFAQRVKETRGDQTRQMLKLLTSGR